MGAPCAAKLRLSTGYDIRLWRTPLQKDHPASFVGDQHEQRADSETAWTFTDEPCHVGGGGGHGGGLRGLLANSLHPMGSARLWCISGADGRQPHCIFFFKLRALKAK